MGVLLGAIYPAIDCMAGEKERGTLETLFTLPISNLELNFSFIYYYNMHLLICNGSISSKYVCLLFSKKF